MDLLPSEEQQEIVASIASLLDAEVSIARVRELSAMADVIDRKLIAKCGDLGWFTLGLAEELGGVGYGLAEEALLMRELGRHLTPGPFLAMILGARLAALAGEAEIASDIGSGAKTVGLAVAEGELSVAANGAVSGEVMCVDGSATDLVLVTTDGWSALFDATSIASRVDHECLDVASRVSTLSLSSATPLASRPESDVRIHMRGTVLAAALLSGLSEGSRDLAALHARERHQFGKPIGVNQAIKHVCTDMAVRSEAASCQTFFAAMTVDKLEQGEAMPDAAFQVAAAKVVALDAAYKNSRHDIQVHGGMGFTAENDSQLYMKRAHVLAEVFGDRRQLLAEIIAAAPVQ